MTNFRIILNVIGNLVLAAGLHMDAAGAAIATVTGILLNVGFYIYLNRTENDGTQG